MSSLYRRGSISQDRGADSFNCELLASRAQAERRELLQRLLQRGQSMRVGSVIRPHTPTRDAHQTRLTQHLQVVRDRGLAEVKVVDDVTHADRARLGGDQAEDLQPRRVAQRSERGHHLVSLGSREGSDAGGWRAGLGRTQSRAHGSQYSIYIDGRRYVILDKPTCLW